MKMCKSCNINLDDSMFSKNGKYLSSYCKDCSKKYQKKYHRKDRRETYQKKYKEEYRKSNKDSIAKNEKLIRNYSATFTIGYELVEMVENRDGVLYVECKGCGKMYNPTYGDVMSRLTAIRDTSRGSSFLYCSQKCKDSCGVYNKSEQSYIINHMISTGKMKRRRSKTSAEANAIMAARERDGGVCVVCGNECDLEGHHITPYKFLVGTDDEYLIYDTSNIETVCKWCHINIKHTGDISFWNIAKADSRKSICTKTN